MADSLTIADVVNTLVDLDLVDLDGEGPWPGEPDDADAYEPDWEGASERPWCHRHADGYARRELVDPR